MIVCDELLKDATRPGKPLIVGLTSLVRWSGDAEPTTLAKMTVFLVLTDGRGTGRGLIRCVDETDGEVAFESAAIPISFVGRRTDRTLSSGFRLRTVPSHVPTTIWSSSCSTMSPSRNASSL